MNRARIYPHLATRALLDEEPNRFDGYALPIGHDLSTIIVEDSGGATRFLDRTDLEAEGLDIALAHNLAQLNLQQLWKDREITAQLLRTPKDRHFLVWHSHWLAASCIYLSDLSGLVERHLRTRDVLISVPHPATMIAFPRGDRAARDEMRALIRENEGDALKPLTQEWFGLTPDGVTEFHED